MEPWNALLEYWRSRHVDGRPPGRKDIDPAIDIPVLAPNLLIADVVPEGYRYRLTGSAIVERHQEDMTGKMAGTSRFLELVREDLIASYDAVRIGRRPRILTTGVAGNEHSEAVTVILPLSGVDGETEMLLIGVFYERRFEPIERIDFLNATPVVE